MNIFDQKFTLEKQDDEGNTILHSALYKRDWKLINTIMNQIVREDTPCVLNIQNNDGDTALHIAVRRLPLNPISNKMIELGADPKIKNKNGEFVKIADTLGKYFEYVKYDLNLSDLEEASEEEEKVNQGIASPVNITIINVARPFGNYNNDDDDDDDDDKQSGMFLNSIDFPTNISIEEPITPTLTSEMDVQTVVENPMMIDRSTIMQPKISDAGETINVIKNNQFNVPSKTSISSFVEKLIQENK